MSTRLLWFALLEKYDNMKITAEQAKAILPLAERLASADKAT